MELQEHADLQRTCGDLKSESEFDDFDIKSEPGEELSSIITIKEEVLESENELEESNVLLKSIEGNSEQQPKRKGRPPGSRNKMRRTSYSLRKSRGVKVSPKPNVSNRQVINRGDFKCHLCPNSYSTKRNVSRHLRRTHYKNSNHLKCSECGRRMRDEEERRLHVKYVHNTNYSLGECKCDECGKVFSIRRHLLVHVRNVHIENWGDCLCDICGTKSVNRKAIRAHIVQNHIPRFGKNKPKCQVCKITFSYVVQLKNHLRTTCKKMKPVECTLCKGMFKNDNTLKNHIWQYHNDAKEGYLFECYICAESFLRRQYLSQHLRNEHTLLKNQAHQCPFCNKIYNQRSILNGHIKYVHALAKERHECQFCMRSYHRPHHLVRHIREKHNRHMRPNSCSSCNVQFKNKLALDMHVPRCKHNGKLAKI